MSRKINYKAQKKTSFERTSFVRLYNTLIPVSSRKICNFNMPDFEGPCWWMRSKMCVRWVCVQSAFGGTSAGEKGWGRERPPHSFRLSAGTRRKTVFSRDVHSRALLPDATDFPYEPFKESSHKHAQSGSDGVTNRRAFLACLGETIPLAAHRPAFIGDRRPCWRSDRESDTLGHNSALKIFRNHWILREAPRSRALQQHTQPHNRSPQGQ